MSSATCFNLDQSKILLSGNGLKFISGHGTADFFPTTVETQDRTT